MELAQESDHIQLVGEIHNNMGNVYKRIGDYAGSLEAYLEAEKAYDSVGYYTVWPGQAIIWAICLRIKSN
ncbi:hypothetical protein D5R40_29890 [Okeania hirsuta]|uniref:Tetratricopeptide repeat protein n=1 Tax=Okeania hirsuta TaxID=1458930 RepID=A0A3N6NX97_9CYAN|nr:hypothetical protein D5R40_29890 [Okeania hirsuta]